MSVTVLRRRLPAVVRGSVFATKGNALFFVAFSAANVCSFLFHLIVSRMLGPADYGALGALLGLTVILLVPLGALQTSLTQAMAPRLQAGARVVDIAIAPVLASAVLWALGAFAVFAALSPLLQSFLHLESIRVVIALGCSIIPFVIGVVPKAVLLAQLRFIPLAAAMIAGSVVRVVSGALLVDAGFGVLGALSATVLAELTTTALALVPLRSELRHDPTATPVVPSRRDRSVAIAAFTGFWAFTVIDVLLARHGLGRVQSGLYVAASTAASSILFLAGAVSAVAFPRFAAAGGRGVEARRSLIQAFSLVQILCIPTAAVFALAPTFVVRILFGEEYRPASAVLWILALAAACVAGVQVLLHFLIARRSAGALIPWLGVAAAAALILVGPRSLNSIAITMGSVAGGLVTAMFLLALRPTPEEAHPPVALGARLWDDIPELDVTVVVPYFNPGARFRPSLEALLDVLASSAVTAEVIAVADGCTDGSPQLIADLASPVLQLVELSANAGKGEALRIGLSNGRGRFLGFIDADGDIDAGQLTTFLELIRLYEPDIVLGSKRHAMSTVDYPVLRRVYSWGYQRLCAVLFRLNVRDTQTGLKFVKREVIADALPLMVEKRFAFDLELLVVARRLGYRRFFEAPVRLNQRFSSTIDVGAVWRMLVDTLAIFYRLRVLRYYDRPATGRRERSGEGVTASRNDLDGATVTSPLPTPGEL